jgi:Zn-dependent protease with chaperone function
MNGKAVGFAAAIVWAVLPRPDRFVPPGPTIRSANEPALFDVITEVAAATAQEMPSEVYLVNDVNAFVAQRGGTMRFGSRRVMGIGLPLMQAVTVQEFKGILAHEFGHYHAGDVTIGTWIHKTRGAIARAIRQLEDSVLQKVFICAKRWALPTCRLRALM